MMTISVTLDILFRFGSDKKNAQVGILIFNLLK